MSADFTTTLKIKGTKEECLEIMKLLCYCSKEMEERYRKKRDCWYLWASFDSPEKEVEQRWKSGKMELVMCGPYGVLSGAMLEGVDLFERIADVAGAARFSGKIDGFSGSEDYESKAEYKKHD